MNSTDLQRCFRDIESSFKIALKERGYSIIHDEDKIEIAIKNGVRYNFQKLYAAYLDHRLLGDENVDWSIRLAANQSDTHK